MGIPNLLDFFNSSLFLLSINKLLKQEPENRIGYNGIYELKNHCVRYHNGSLDKCVINYRLLPGYAEIEVKKDAYRYIIHEDDLLDKETKIY